MQTQNTIFFFTSFFSYCNLRYQGLTKCFKKKVSAFELNNFTGDFVSSLFGSKVHLWQRIFLQRNYYQFFCFTCELITHNSFLTLFLTSLLGVLNLWRISLWLAKVVDPYSSKIAEFPANNSTYRAAKSCRAVVLKKLVGKRRLTCEEEPRKAVLYFTTTEGEHFFPRIFLVTRSWSWSSCIIVVRRASPCQLLGLSFYSSGSSVEKGCRASQKHRLRLSVSNSMKIYLYLSSKR